MNVRDRLRSAVGLNLALAAVMSADRSGDPSYRPGSRQAEAALRRRVATDTARTAAGILPAAAAELVPFFAGRAGRLVTAHLDLVVTVARTRGWDLSAPGSQTLVRLALIRLTPAAAAELLGVDPGATLTPKTFDAVARAALWSANRYAALRLPDPYLGRPEPTTPQVALAAVELFAPIR